MKNNGVDNRLVNSSKSNSTILQPSLSLFLYALGNLPEGIHLLIPHFYLKIQKPLSLYAPSTNTPPKSHNKTICYHFTAVLIL